MLPPQKPANALIDQPPSQLCFNPFIPAQIELRERGAIEVIGDA